MAAEAAGGKPRLYLALVHYPVYNREGETVATSVTPLDVHDFGRTGLTYGVAGYYITNPYESQQQLVGEIIRHWRDGLGGEHSPQRKRAVARAFIVPSAAAAFDDVAAREGAQPFVVATSARHLGEALPPEKLIEVAAGKPVLVLFGTGYGLTDDLLYAADAVLEPIQGREDFNHLPVRAAVAIYLDRFFRAGR